MSATLNPLLFVYGSLLSTAGHPMGARLAAEAELVGPASVQGRLYRIDWYPGAVEGTAGEERVHGEVYRLGDPAAALAWLDAYEGLTRPGPHDYERVVRTARLADGEEVAAWVYYFRAGVDGKERVADGRWRPQPA